MPSITKTIERLSAMRQGLAPTSIAAAIDRLADMTGFGDNPGALRARTFVPAGIAPGAALVVVLHGCTQTAAAYDAGTGWSTLADRAGFAVAFAEQRRSNNPNLCFNWFQSPDTDRTGGEAESIAQIAEAMIARHGLDRTRIFVTGLSAGGAMTATMLATYPDLFAGGAIIGGLPYGGAPGVSAALERMAGRDRSSPAARVDAAAQARDHAGRKPTVSIWHGTADPTVVVANMDHLAEQWRGVHGVGEAPSSVERGDGWERHRWIARGRTVVETWRIAGMAHGVPIDPDGAERLGAVGPYMLAAGIDSTAAIARSWDLIPAGVQAPARPAIAATSTATPTGRAIPVAAAARTTPAHGIQRVIEDALRTAGLMK